MTDLSVVAVLFPVGLVVAVATVGMCTGPVSAEVRHRLQPRADQLGRLLCLLGLAVPSQPRERLNRPCMGPDDLIDLHLALADDEQVAQAMQRLGDAS